MKTLAKFVMLLAVLAFCLPADGEILIYTKTVKCFGAEGELEVDDGGDWDWYWAGDERITGYLILDVEYDGDEIVAINNAEQVDYWREEGGKWYEQMEEGFDVERIDIEDRWGRPIVYWVLEDWYSDEDEGYEYIYFAMLRGKARLVNIGLGWKAEEKREVASMLEGCMQYFDWWLEEGEPDMEYIEKGTCCATLRLHPSWTRLANLYWHAYEEDGGDGWTIDPFQWAVGGIAEGPYWIDGELIEPDEDEPYGIVKKWLEWLGYEEIDGMAMPVEL